jgi:nucleoside-diphosphate-sugar epimerase
MRVAITGGTGFLGRYIIRELVGFGHDCSCWFRPSSDRGGFEEQAPNLTWVEGDLGSPESMDRLVDGCEAVVHSGLFRPGAGFRGAEGDLSEFVRLNVLGTIQLIEATRRAGVLRFVFISTCAVHELILQDRPLDEAHPLWATSHYGAHKAAIEKFVHSYGLGSGYDICAIRPTGIYGPARPIESSKWYEMIHAVKRGDDVDDANGGKEVHAADVATAVRVLLTTAGIAGQAFNCYDRYVSNEEVAKIAKELCGSSSRISSSNQGTRNQIETGKLRALGVTFGGEDRLRDTIAQLLQSSSSSSA